MTNQPDDISKYVLLTEASILEDSSILEGTQITDLNTSSLLVEDINDMVFKFRSYYETEGSSDYISGIEEGLALAANMLERLLERHSGISSK